MDMDGWMDADADEYLQLQPYILVELNASTYQPYFGSQS